MEQLSIFDFLELQTPVKPFRIEDVLEKAKKIVMPIHKKDFDIVEYSIRSFCQNYYTPGNTGNDGPNAHMDIALDIGSHYCVLTIINKNLEEYNKGIFNPNRVNRCWIYRSWKEMNEKPHLYDEEFKRNQDFTYSVVDGINIQGYEDYARDILNNIRSYEW
ncbi:hypothetical protein [Bacillus massiliglaciei]|uniref:hypothetical protein n=1 Tax=Bacillus massiliglaciei TaxID=1816693 RepID=UPI000DA63585|nr:hypothetical protein [Bacillus massiliglaciei]